VRQARLARRAPKRASALGQAGGRAEGSFADAAAASRPGVARGLLEVPPVMRWTTQDGSVLVLNDARARAIAAVGRSRGARAFLGVPLDSGDDATTVSRIKARIGEVARRAHLAGRVPFAGYRLPVFASTTDAGLGLIARPLDDGSFAIVAVMRPRPAAPPPAYVPELDRYELQYDFNLKPMDARLIWSDNALTLDQIRADPKYRDKLSNLVYIPVDKQGQALKVGQSNALANPEPRKVDGKRQGPEPRYPRGAEPAAHGADRFWVARIVPRKGARDADLSGAAAQAERVVARKLHLMGLPLSDWHKAPDPTEPLRVGTSGRGLRLRDAVPEALRQQQLQALQKQPNHSDVAVSAQIKEARSTGLRVRPGHSRELEG
jgi:hypothetical protein